MNFKELETIYEVILQQYAELSYKEFDDLAYDMRHMEYKMIGMLERGELMCYAGVAVQTNFYYKRHLFIFDLVADKKYRGRDYTNQMLEYLETYARTAMCANIVLSSNIESTDAQVFYEKNGFNKKSSIFFKNIEYGDNK